MTAADLLNAIVNSFCVGLRFGFQAFLQFSLAYTTHVHMQRQSQWWYLYLQKTFNSLHSSLGHGKVWEIVGFTSKSPKILRETLQLELTMSDPNENHFQSEKTVIKWSVCSNEAACFINTY